MRYQTYGNIEKLTRWQLEGYVQWKPFKSTTLSANFNIWDDKIENPSIGLRQKGYSGFYYLNGSQQLPWKLRLTAYVYGEMGHSVNNVYSYSRPWNRYGCSLQRSFLSEDKLTVRISANDLFNRYRHSVDCTDQGDMLGYSDTATRGSRLTFSISYRFGKLKASVKKTETTIDNSDVVGGITKRK